MLFGKVLIYTWPSQLNGDFYNVLQKAEYAKKPKINFKPASNGFLLWLHYLNTIIHRSVHVDFLLLKNQTIRTLYWCVVFQHFCTF